MKLTRSKVHRAGKILKKSEPATEAYVNAMDVLSEWRRAHNKPMQLALGELRVVAAKIDKDVILASRPKRAQSIIEKLIREASMSLNMMQDIGGCRVVLRTLKDVNKTATAMKKKKHISLAKNHIKTPKIDGYRGIHLVGVYGSGEIDKLQIEFQIRTRIQHAWATAGEITELFTNKSIKNLQGDTEWKEFYKLVADIFHRIDNDLTRRDVEFEQIYANELIIELRSMIYKDKELRSKVNSLKTQNNKLGVVSKFQAYSNSLSFIGDNQSADTKLTKGYFLIEAKFLNLARPEIKLFHYGEDGLKVAHERVNEIERSIRGQQGALVVLVSSEAAGGIRQSYPNYFADSKLFTQLLTAILKT